MSCNTAINKYMYSKIKHKLRVVATAVLMMIDRVKESCLVRLNKIRVPHPFLIQNTIHTFQLPVFAARSSHVTYAAEGAG